MKHFYLLIFFLLTCELIYSQTISQRLQTAFEKLKTDSSLKHASLSLYVVNSKTNEIVFDYNSQLGLAPASCQKIITSITAFEILGKDYHYKTEVGYNGEIKKGILTGNLIINGFGDPTLGSWRYKSTKDTSILNNWMNAIVSAGIKRINGNVVLNTSSFSLQPIPGGWTWEDIGNYYGAGSWGLNWYENQYDLTLKPGNKEGDSATIISTKPEQTIAPLINNIKTDIIGSSDYATIYMSPYSKIGVVEGSLPANNNTVIISGANPNPLHLIGKIIEDGLNSHHIKFKKITNSIEDLTENNPIQKTDSVFYTNYSPSLDSINYWFMKKSINLYGEAFVKTIAFNKSKIGSTEEGVKIIKEFWKEIGIDKSELRISDGSGLSPQNRLTTNALVKALQYAREKSWFSSFYNALPLYNGMKLKSGTISGTKGFAGYHTSKSGTDYTVAIIVNNFDGSSSEIVKKIFLVLDELK